MESKDALVEGFNERNNMELYYNAANVDCDKYLKNKLSITIIKVT